MATSEMQARNIELAMRTFEVWLSGDVEGTLALMDPEIEIFVPAELVNAGTFRGHDEFLRWISDWNEAWSDGCRLDDRAPRRQDHRAPPD